MGYFLLEIISCESHVFGIYKLKHPIWVRVCIIFMFVSATRPVLEISGKNICILAPSIISLRITKGVLFFQSRRTSWLRIGVTSMDTPRERAAILRQRDASEHYIFSSLLHRRLIPAIFLSASNSERSLSLFLCSERQSERFGHAPLSAPERRPTLILHVYSLSSGLRTPG